MVRCRDGSLYVGMTNDVQERLKEHNWGVKSEFTAKRRPVTLVWTEEQPSHTVARKRETQVKGWRREKKLKLAEEYRRRTNPSPSAQGKGE